MSIDLAALAPEVDRLFRARQKRLVSPKGKGIVVEGRWNWCLASEERNASEMLRYKLEGKDIEAYKKSMLFYEGASPRHMQTRMHVAMLALTDNDYFTERLKDIEAAMQALDERFVKDIEDLADSIPDVPKFAFENVANKHEVELTFVYQTFGQAVLGLPISLPPIPAQRPADVERTYRYLVRLADRLYKYNEQQAAKRALEVGETPDPDVEREAARRKDEMAGADADGELDMLAEMATQTLTQKKTAVACPRCP